MKKIAIYGGSFNPIGKHHIEIANKLLTLVDEVWITPCYKSMTKKVMESDQDRLNMCQIAIDENNRKSIKLCDFEIKNKLHDESVIIIRKFLDYYQDRDININKFYFLIGSDNARTINTWSDWEGLINMLPFIVYPRNGYMVHENCWCKKLPHIYLENANPINGSSTEIRNNINNTELKLISHNVINYIAKHQLYDNHFSYMEI